MKQVFEMASLWQRIKRSAQKNSTAIFVLTILQWRLHRD